jgi:hypothetical protein
LAYESGDGSNLAHQTLMEREMQESAKKIALLRSENIALKQSVEGNQRSFATSNCEKISYDCYCISNGGTISLMRHLIKRELNLLLIVNFMSRITKAVGESVVKKCHYWNEKR